MAWIPVAPPRLDLGAALFDGRLDSYGVDAYGLDSYGCPPDWPWGTHFSVIVRRWVAWICMAFPRLDLRVALFVGRLDPCGVDPHGLDPYGFPPTGPRVALFVGRLDPYGVDPHGLDPYGFPPTGLAGRTFRWPLGSLWC